jgi:hypothetical protein
MSAEWKDEELQQSLKSLIKSSFLFLQSYNPSPLKTFQNITQFKYMFGSDRKINLLFQVLKANQTIV